MNTITICEAKAQEFDAAALIFACALINDPALRWIGSVPESTTLPHRHDINPNTLSTFPKQLRMLYYVHHSVLLAARLLKEEILVAVRSEKGAEDKILAVTVWLPPGAKVDGALTIVRSRNFRAITGTFRHPGGWGLTGFKRVAISYEKRIQKHQKKLLKSKGIDHSRAWHLLDVATDPAEEGKGYCGKLLRYGLQEIVKDAPVYLEATTPRSQNLYLHLGFEISDNPLFGVKTVTETGLPLAQGQKESATGVPVWTMVYLKTSNP